MTASFFRDIVGSLQRSTHSNLFRFSRMIYYVIRPRGALCNAAISMSVHPSVCPMPLAQKGAFYGYGYYGTLLENPTLEVKPTGRRGLNGSTSFRCHQGDTLFINLFQTGGWAKREGKGGVSKGRILGKPRMCTLVSTHVTSYLYPSDLSTVSTHSNLI